MKTEADLNTAWIEFLATFCPPGSPLIKAITSDCAQKWREQRAEYIADDVFERMLAELKRRTLDELSRGKMGRDLWVSSRKPGVN